jgi:hypothetical protein
VQKRYIIFTLKKKIGEQTLPFSVKHSINLAAAFFPLHFAFNNECTFQTL